MCVNEETLETSLEMSQQHELTTGARGNDARSCYDSAGRTPPIPLTGQSAKRGIRRVVPPDHEALGQHMQRGLQESQDIMMRNSREEIGLASQGTPPRSTVKGAVCRRRPEALGNKAPPREWCTYGCGTSALALESRHTDPKATASRPHAASGERRSSVERGRVITQTECGDERSSEVSTTRSGASNFPRAETAPVAVQLSDDRQSRDECLHGRTQLWASATRQLMPQEGRMLQQTSPEATSHLRARQQRQE